MVGVGVEWVGTDGLAVKDDAPEGLFGPSRFQLEASITRAGVLATGVGLTTEADATDVVVDVDCVENPVRGANASDGCRRRGEERRKGEIVKSREGGRCTNDEVLL